MFDCDGVLVDSEGASETAWRQTLHGFGYRMGAAEFEGWIGTTDHSMAVHYAPLLGTDVVTLDRIAAQSFLDVVGRGLDVYPDAIELLGRLAGTPLAVASNSRRGRLEAVLGAAGLGDIFAVSVASDEVPRPKPEPDVYLAAAQLLEVRPREVLVIEDSPTGIEAATKAAMSVVAIDRGMFTREALAAADLVVPSLA